MPLNGLSSINLELSSRCDKSCSFCGHQDPAINKKLEYGDMDYALLEKIAKQIPDGIIVQFHRDGEPLIYPKLKSALQLFNRHIRNIVTNGNKLFERFDDLTGNCEVLTVSVFRGDVDGQKQLQALCEFILKKTLTGWDFPSVMIKIVGDLEPERLSEYQTLGVPIIHRALHLPEGSFGYVRGQPIIPEAGVCLDFLSHPSIDWQGHMFICNRLDPDDQGYLGDLNSESLENIWNGNRRKEWLRAHIRGRRDKASPLCAKCEYWGIPTG